MRGGNLAFAKFSWANFAIRSFRIIYSFNLLASLSYYIFSFINSFSFVLPSFFHKDQSRQLFLEFMKLETNTDLK